jgi:MFS family permease
MLSALRHRNFGLYMIAQGCLGLLALAVGMVAGIGTIRVWMIWLAAGALGLVKCFDLPALQSFVKDLVGPDDLPNAVAWTNAVSATGRLIGPSFGGMVLTAFGASLAAMQLAVSVAHALIPLLAATFAYGLCAGLFSVTAISTLQSQAADDMRGRVMALYSICFLGSSPIGGPAFGALAGWVGVSAALRVGACICAAAALTGTIVWQLNFRLRHT